MFIRLRIYIQIELHDIKCVFTFVSLICLIFSIVMTPPTNTIFLNRSNTKFFKAFFAFFTNPTEGTVSKNFFFDAPWCNVAKI